MGVDAEGEAVRRDGRDGDEDDDREVGDDERAATVEAELASADATRSAASPFGLAARRARSWVV